MFEQLVMLSLSSDLLVAGKDVAGENAAFLKRVADHEAEKVAAEAEYQRRLTAAADRRAVAQKAAGKKSKVQTDEKSGSPKALPLSPAMKLRALPIQRGTKGP